MFKWERKHTLNEILKTKSISDNSNAESRHTKEIITVLIYIKNIYIVNSSTKEYKLEFLCHTYKI